MIRKEEIVEIGMFQKTHALKGELNAILTIDADFFEEGRPLIVAIDGIFVPFYIESIRPKGKTSYLLKIKGIDSEEKAKIFVNKKIYAIRSMLTPFLDLDEDDILEDTLIGFEVRDDDSGEMIGTVKDIDDSTQNVLLIVDKGDGSSDLMIPLVDDFISEIDEQNKIVKVNLPPGLIELNC